MEKISIRKAYKTAWNKFMERPWFLFSLGVGVWVLLFLGSSSNAAFTALGYIIYGGYLGVLMMHMKGEQIVFDDLFSLDNRWISFVFMGMIKAVFLLLGFLLFIIPGIYLMVKWMFAEYLVIEKGMRPMEALRKSSEMTKGHRWKLFFFALASILVMLVGTLLLFVGVIPAGIIVVLATISIYKKLLNSSNQEVQA
ncbi:MAG: glycerophosphoryl diester phosphodiesterase membrane domain-containing protein [Patescibacteria group bacterium UBA2103]